MQRRAAAVYFALFVVVGVGAYGFLTISGPPPVDLDGPTYGQGDELSVGGVTYTVTNVTAETVNLSWMNQTAGETDFVEFGEGENATLGGTQHFAHFPESGGVQVLPNNQYWDSYQGDLELQDQYGERRAGVWAILFMSFLAAIVLLSAAYMPVRG